jgi:hypothetical protein
VRDVDVEEALEVVKGASPPGRTMRVVHERRREMRSS